MRLVLAATFFAWAALAALGQDDLSPGQAPVSSEAAPAAPPATVKFADGLFPVFQKSKCTNCHGMDNLNKNFERHVALNRFPKGTYAVDVMACRRCHTRAKGFADDWHAPPAEMDFSGKSSKDTCKMIKASFSNDSLRDHLKSDARIKWAVSKLKVPGWAGMVDEWIAGGMKCD